MAWTERYCSVAGGGAHDGTSAANAWTLAEARTSAASGQRVNMIAGTYPAGGDITFGTGNVWWRGYNTTIGDCDLDPTLARPHITHSSFEYTTINGTGQIFSSVNFTGQRATTDGVILCNATGLYMYRCRIVNNGNNASSRLIYLNNDEVCVFEACLFEGGTTIPIGILARHDTTFLDCTFRGFGTAVRLDSAGGTYASTFAGCIFEDSTSYAIQLNSGSHKVVDVDRCSFYNIGADAIRYTSIGTVMIGRVSNCIFSVIGGYGINNATGSDTYKVKRSNNLFHSVTTAQENGFGDYPAFRIQTSVSSPFTNAAADDFSPVGTALGNGSPGSLEL